jgi:hypothetical protein
MGCTNENGDKLLFQWGTYDWGDGTQFEINITRQFIESAAEDDDAISPLQLTFKFPTDKDAAALGDGNRWCHPQAEVQQFREFIFSSQAFLAKVDWDHRGVSVQHKTSSESVLPESYRSWHRPKPIALKRSLTAARAPEGFDAWPDEGGL